MNLDFAGFAMTADADGLHRRVAGGHVQLLRAASRASQSIQRCGYARGARRAQFANTVSQVLARPSEWLELFKAPWSHGAFFFAVAWRKRADISGSTVGPFRINPVSKMNVLRGEAPARQRAWRRQCVGYARRLDQIVHL
jgi:hypothetical protein